MGRAKRNNMRKIIAYIPDSDFDKFIVYVNEKYGVKDDGSPAHGGVSFAVREAIKLLIEKSKSEKP